MEKTLKSTHHPRNAMILALIWTFVNISPILAKVNQAAQVVFEFSKTKAPTNDTRQLAVAFHSITYIDSVAHSLGEVILGTSQANALQGEGWFSNDNWPGVGSFQWTGGSTKRAVITLSIPQGTEGLLLKINSIEDTLWMTVKVDGQTAATLRVDAYWHSGYVPIGQPRAPFLSHRLSRCGCRGDISRTFRTLSGFMFFVCARNWMIRSLHMYLHSGWTKTTRR